MGRCLPGVRVGLLLQGERLVGLFPHEMESTNTARPVGSVFCDYQALIAPPGLPWDPESLLQGLGLAAWRFDHLLAMQAPWKPYVQRRDISWSIDLSQGYQSLEALLRERGSDLLAECRRKHRQLEKAAGPLRFVPHTQDHALLDTLLAWKSAQWAESGWPGRYTTAWEQALMHGLLETQTPDFGGILTALYAADRPVAIHMGLRSRRVWHYWTTAYDPAFKRFSPGILMLMEMLRHAPTCGLWEVDLGKEDFEYKRRLHTHAVPVWEGVARTA